MRRTRPADFELDPWRSEPLASGEWREFSARDAAHILERLPRAVLEAAPFPLPTFRTRMRTQSIACLPGWSVVEAEICSGTGHCAVLRLLADATALLPLDGSANPFRIAALQDFDARELADDRAVRQYLRVYVGSVHTRGHSFGIYGSSAGKEEQGITVRRSPVGSVVCLTRVQYEDQLFAARLGITTGGDVTILRDRFLGRRPVSRNRTLWGPWEVIGLS